MSAVRLKTPVPISESMKYEYSQLVWMVLCRYLKIVLGKENGNCPDHQKPLFLIKSDIHDISPMLLCE